MVFESGPAMVNHSSSYMVAAEKNALRSIEEEVWLVDCFRSAHFLMMTRSFSFHLYLRCHSRHRLPSIIIDPTPPFPLTSCSLAHFPLTLSYCLSTSLRIAAFLQDAEIYGSADAAKAARDHEALLIKLKGEATHLSDKVMRGFHFKLGAIYLFKPLWFVIFYAFSLFLVNPFVLCSGLIHLSITVFESFV